MPYREIHLGNETFIARVSDEAVKEWEGVRERNKNIGYPDRPPDVDTPLHRAWIPHNPYENEHYMTLGKPSSESFPVCSFSGSTVVENNIGIEGKLLVGYDSTKDKYEIRRIARLENGVTLGDISFYISPDDIEEAFDRELARWAKLFGKDVELFIGTYSDFQELYDETDTAFKELEEYYQNPKKLVH